MEDKHYISVQFEDYHCSTPENRKFQSREYTYMTSKDLKTGQLLTIDTPYSENVLVRVVNESVDPDTITFDKSLIKEI